MQRNNLPFVSIIIVNYNGKELLKSCLPSFREIEYPNDRYEVIIVDNNSSDDSILFLRKNFTWAKVIENKRNLGWGGGINSALPYARGDFIAVVNNDMEAHPLWLLELIKVITSDSRIGFCGSKTLDFHNRRLIDCDGPRFSRLCYVGKSRMGELDDGKGEIREIPYRAVGVFRKELFEVVGNYDESYFIHYDDVDIMLRAWICGYKIMYVPSSVLYHKLSSSSSLLKAPRTVFLIERNSLMLFLKIYSLKNIIIYLPFVVLSRTLYIIRDLFLLHPKVALARLKAILWVFRNMKPILDVRQRIQKKRKLPDSIFLSMSIESQLWSKLKTDGIVTMIKEFNKLLKDVISKDSRFIYKK